MESIAESIITVTAAGRVIIRDQGSSRYGQSIPAGHERWKYPHLILFKQRGMKISAINELQPVHPDVEAEIKETPSEIRIPYETYFGSLYPYGKAKTILADLLKSISSRHAFVYSSTTRHILAKIHNDESRDWRRDVDSESFRSWMLYSLTSRYTRGKVLTESKDTAEFVLSTLSCGPNIDIKLPEEEFGPHIYNSVVEYFEDLHQDTLTYIDTVEVYEDGTSGEVVTSYFLDPKDTSWNEPGFSFPAHMSLQDYNGYDIEVRPEGAKPVVKVTTAPIPNNAHHMRYAKVEFGYFFPNKKTILPDPEVITMRLHITHTTADGADLRDNENNTSWQILIKGKIRGGFVHLDKQAVRGWQQPVELADTVFDDTSFGVMEVFRCIRAHLTRFNTSQHEMFASINGLTISEAFGDVLPAGYFLEKNRRIIERGVDQVESQPPKIDPQLRKEILSDIATSCLVSPLGFSEIMRRSKAYKWFKGVKEFSDQDMDQLSHEMYKTLGKAYGFTDPTNEPYPDNTSTPNERWWVNELYKTNSRHPAIKRDGEKKSGHYLSWNYKPDGITEIVKAIEKIRRKKGLAILSRKTSTISKFCEYFGMVF